MENELRTPCARQTRSNGESFICGGHYEVRIAAYFDRSFTEKDGVRLTFTTLGGGDGTEGVVINCTDCGEPAPRVFYGGLLDTIHALEEKLRKALA
ncbi:hypothetical protein ABZS53_15425 [Streptomyces sp. NPDC005499]|uniref:hypothetical protein n=1 Tax=Streptomyces sp. NPDC005499 TaxID=3154883 RepID=UPI0033A0B473